MKALILFSNCIVQTFVFLLPSDSIVAYHSLMVKVFPPNAFSIISTVVEYCCIQ